MGHDDPGMVEVLVARHAITQRLKSDDGPMTLISPQYSPQDVDEAGQTLVRAEGAESGISESERLHAVDVVPVAGVAQSPVEHVQGEPA